MRRLLPVLLAATVVLLVLAPSAAARDEDDAIVVITGDVDVAAEERVGDVIVVDGDIDVAGEVDGDVVAVAGDVRLRGQVRGEVVTFAGRLTALPESQITGDVSYADERPVISPRATVGGDISEEDWDDSFWVAGLIGHLAFWLAISVSTLVLGLLLIALAPQAADATHAAFRRRPGTSVALGLGIFIGLPILAVIAMITLVGLPLGLALLAALVPFWAVGYVAGAYVLGRRVLGPPRGRYLAFIAGWGILRALALLPALGSLFSLAAVVVGLGALGLAITEARREQEPAAGAPAPA